MDQGPPRPGSLEGCWRWGVEEGTWCCRERGIHGCRGAAATPPSSYTRRHRQHPRPEDGPQAASRLGRRRVSSPAPPGKSDTPAAARSGKPLPPVVLPRPRKHRIVPPVVLPRPRKHPIAPPVVLPRPRKHRIVRDDGCPTSAETLDRPIEPHLRRRGDVLPAVHRHPGRVGDVRSADPTTPSTPGRRRPGDPMAPSTGRRRAIGRSTTPSTPGRRRPGDPTAPSTPWTGRRRAIGRIAGERRSRSPATTKSCSMAGWQARAAVPLGCPLSPCPPDTGDPGFRPGRAGSACRPASAGQDRPADPALRTADLALRPAEAALRPAAASGPAMITPAAAPRSAPARRSRRRSSSARR